MRQPATQPYVMDTRGATCNTAVCDAKEDVRRWGSGGDHYFFFDVTPVRQAWVPGPGRMCVELVQVEFILFFLFHFLLGCASDIECNQILPLLRAC